MSFCEDDEMSTDLVKYDSESPRSVAVSYFSLKIVI